MKDIRVLIVEDSLTIRHYLSNLIEESPHLTVIGMARNGQDALAQVVELQPHVISMDVNMPEMDGIEATQRIMEIYPTPVVIVSSLVEHEVDLSIRALQAGALAVVPKPPSREHPDFARIRRQLLTGLQAMAGVKVIRRWSNGDRPTSPKPPLTIPYETRRFRPPPQIIGIAASAGGPSALSTFLTLLKKPITVPIVIVQHMPSEFITGLTRWLAKATQLPIHLVEDGEILQDGVIYIAQGDKHIVVQRKGSDFIAHLIADKGKFQHQPSANLLFESLARVSGERAVGIILTGMGNDGATGLTTLRQNGGRTYAQNETSSTVFGMPSAAIEAGAVERVLSLEHLSAAISILL